jgi:ribA/ribD-fused uncharacterized protein
MSKEYIKNWFSNMLPFDEPLVVDGISYPAVENYYQAMKLHENDFEGRKLLASVSPRKSKTLVREMKYRELSYAEKIYHMRVALEHKFTITSSWGKKLLETGNEPIIEYNNWGDTFFGFDVEKGEGKNILGLLLMARREELLMEKLLNESF